MSIQKSIEIFVLKHTCLKSAFDLLIHVYSWFYTGNKYECPICQGNYRALLPAGNQKERLNSKCPRCRSLERHRLIWLYLKKRTNFCNVDLKVLYVAPEYCFIQKFDSLKNIDYLSIDLESPLAMRKMDITDLNLADSSFDCIICLHVLEHVENDSAAIKEFYRILRPKGWAILQVPILRKMTFEDPKINTKEARLKHFGQEDHVREYGLDFKDRLEDSGFSLKIENVREFISESSVNRYRLLLEDSILENIYFCKK